MGKLMRKYKGIDEVAVLEVSLHQIGVRTRARTLAMAEEEQQEASVATTKRRKLNSTSQHFHSNSSYIQLRSQCRRKVMQNSTENICSSCSSDHVLVSHRCSSNGSSELLNENIRSLTDLEDKGHDFENCSPYTERREKKVSKCSQSNDMESTGKPTQENSRHKWTEEKTPTDAELEDFFSAAEKDEKKRFEDKLKKKRPKSLSSMSKLLLRRKALEFLIRSSLKLEISPIVKYTSLTLFAERFFQSITNNNRFTTTEGNWLLQKPLTECNFQLFALISIWISTKIHNTRALSVKTLKSLGDKVIKDQHFTTRDFLEAEVVFLQVINFEIGASSITYIFLEDYLIQFRQLARVGELLNTEACMDIMDLLYETEEMSILYDSPRFLAAAVMVVSYITTVPQQQWEFPILPWVNHITSFDVNDIEELAKNILSHVLKEGCEEADCQVLT
ncbi:Cyclin-j18-like [Thalictrum thalictroides]|uniref:Cyclin-j18-like n=1 Tax=Thalictrum thalictroides TaxID=46969 RepID=A0A7J6VLI7_THATH|nr:Cyclin-j18-like [Thalictrum thalictroides]